MLCVSPNVLFTGDVRAHTDTCTRRQTTRKDAEKTKAATSLEGSPGHGRLGQKGQPLFIAYRFVCLTFYTGEQDTLSTKNVLQRSANEGYKLWSLAHWDFSPHQLPSSCMAADESRLQVPGFPRGQGGYKRGATVAISQPDMRGGGALRIFTTKKWKNQLPADRPGGHGPFLCLSMSHSTGREWQGQAPRHGALQSVPGQAWWGR